MVCILRWTVPAAYSAALRARLGFALPGRRGFIPSFPFDKNGEEEKKEKDGWRRRDEPAPGAIAVVCPDYAVRALDRRNNLIPP